MYSIILATAATLFVAGHRQIESAADVVLALKPPAGRFASVLFAIGITGVGMLAVPVMTTGAAYDVCQAAGARTGLSHILGRSTTIVISAASLRLIASY